MKKEYFKLKGKSMNLFFMLSLYFLSILVLYSLCQFLNINKALQLIGIISIVIPIVYILIKEKNISLSIIFLLIVTILPLISTKYYDLSIDGNNYHKL